MSPQIAAFVSPHGFGHAARACGVLQALQANRPDLHVHLFTKVPAWFFHESLGGGYTYHPLMTDVGLVQKNAMAEDLPATLTALGNLLPFDPKQLDQLAAQVTQLGCLAVLCDIAPLGIAVAKTADLPAILVENFTWDWIYRAYEPDWPQLAPYIDRMAAWFGQADVHIQTAPICRPVQGAHPVGPIARFRREDRVTLRAKMGIDGEVPLVLVTMGGMAWDYSYADQLAQMDEIHFVLPGSLPDQKSAEPTPANVHFLDSMPEIYHPDLVGACDGVIGKVGYSTLAEAYWAGTPYGCVTRPQFPESPVLVDFMQEQMSGLTFSPADFIADFTDKTDPGRWIQRIPDLLACPKFRPTGENGAIQAADLILKTIGHS